MIFLKRFYLYFVLFILPYTAKCQYQIGLKAGYNFFDISDQTQTNDIYYSNNYSQTVSLNLNSWVDTNKCISYQFEYIRYAFNRKGREGGLGAGETFDYNFNFGYLYLVILPHFEFGKKTKFFIEPGVYFAGLVSSGIKGEGTYWNMGTSGTFTVDKSAGDYFKSVLFGIKAGLGLEIPINKKLNIIVENSYNKNFGSFYKNDQINIFNCRLEIGISYNFAKNRILDKIMK